MIKKEPEKQKSFQENEDNNLKKRDKIVKKLNSFEKIQLKRYYKMYLDGKWMY